MIGLSSILQLEETINNHEVGCKSPLYLPDMRKNFAEANSGQMFLDVPSASALRTLLALCLLCDALSTVFYVDPINGLDSHDGQTLSSAFQSVQRCVDALHGASAGSECRLRAGQYRSGAYVLVEHLHGQLGNPYVIGKYAADEGEVGDAPAEHARAEGVGRRAVGSQ